MLLVVTVRLFAKAQSDSTHHPRKLKMGVHDLMQQWYVSGMNRVDYAKFIDA
jgi:hypothetical protein